jgi:hypothetical protein
MVKIGGRRGSLADITAKIASLAGVIDQVVFMPTEGEIARPAALIVAPGRNAAELRLELSRLLDAVFVPRPLRVVTALPRDDSASCHGTGCWHSWPKHRIDLYMDHRLRMAAPLTHPCYEGHFPGNPILPAWCCSS